MCAPGYFSKHFPLEQSQRHILQSSDPLANKLPAALKPSEFTWYLCPFNSLLSLSFSGVTSGW